MSSVTVIDIANFLGKSLHGKDFQLEGVCSLDNLLPKHVSFSKKSTINEINLKVLLLVPNDFVYIDRMNYTVIKVDNPRLEFAKVVNHFFSTKPQQGIHSSTVIGNDCTLHPTLSIGSHCSIGKNVSIGENTIINRNVVIADNTKIGNNCYIKSGSIIGEDGFGFDFEEDGTPIRIPHLGFVSIGDNVEIGSNSVIARGTLNNTIIESNVKIDDQVFIAHNCKIGMNTVITAFAEISGSVTIGRNCWIGPNSSIIQKINIADNVTIGIGTTVTKDIDRNKKIMGLEGLALKPLIKLKKRIEYGK